MSPNQAHDGAVVLLETNTDFEAETIAAALNGRGIPARTGDTASTVMLASSVVKAKVLVPGSQETLARQVLDEIRAEMADIDWDAIDLGPEDNTPQMQTARRGRRVLATVCVVLVPVGLGVLAIGTDRHDVKIQAIGGAVTLCSLAIAMGLMLLTGRRVDPDD